MKTNWWREKPAIGRWAVTDNNGWILLTFGHKAEALDWARRCDAPVWLEEYDPETAEYCSVCRI